MCNLYRLGTRLDEVGAFFNAASHGGIPNLGAEIYPGYPGLVVVRGELRVMTWGFPLRIKGKQGQTLKARPVNNARADKLDGVFWRASFVSGRCLIPLTAWAEAEGAAGAKTRTWLSLPDQPLFACAGVWRKSDEWGDVFAMVMTDSVGDVADCHDRMPVILAPQHWTAWLGADPAIARKLCGPYAGPVSLQRTDEPWAKR